jgi:hypothetical protein
MDLVLAGDTDSKRILPSGSAEMAIRPRFTLRTMLWGIVACSVLCAMVLRVYGPLLFPNDVTVEEVRQLKTGMTPAEVLAILGRPNHVICREESEYWVFGSTLWIDFYDGRCEEAYRLSQVPLPDG